MAQAHSESKPPDRGTMTIEEVAAFLGISRGTAYAAVRAGQIPVCRFGRRMVVSRAALAAVMAPPPPT